MRRMNNLVTLFSAMFAFFFGSFITSMLTNIERCPTQKSGIAKMEPHPEMFLIILILSAPRYQEKRKAMRDTWLKLAQPLTQPYFPEVNIYMPQYDERGFLLNQNVEEQSGRRIVFQQWMENLESKHEHSPVKHPERNIKIKHFFAVGTQDLDDTIKAKLHQEHGQHKDMLLLPRLTDIYDNLSEKLLHSIDALTNHYDFSYLLKVDDDTYVKLDYLLNELISYDRKLIRKTAEYNEQPLPALYWGYFNGRAIIKTKGQWREPNYFLSNHYISYALGGGYVISRKITEYITANSQYLSTYVSEDVSLGTWLAPLRNVYRKHDTRFDTGYMPRSCRHHHLVLHKRNETLMHDLFANKLCTFEMANEKQMRRPMEYFYDWQKPADKCCDSIAI